jgi:predicted dehydrogenase
MFEPLMLELRHFVDCVRENRPSQVPGSDGLRALHLAETIVSEVARQAFLNAKVLADQTAEATET